MYQEFYRDNPLLLLPILALVFFIVAFVAMSVLAWRGRGQKNREEALLPFEKDDDSVPVRTSPQGKAHV